MFILKRALGRDCSQHSLNEKFGVEFLGRSGHPLISNSWPDPTLSNCDRKGFVGYPKKFQFTPILKVYFLFRVRWCLLSSAIHTIHPMSFCGYNIVSIHWGDFGKSRWSWLLDQLLKPNTDVHNVQTTYSIFHSRDYHKVSEHTWPYFMPHLWHLILTCKMYGKGSPSH